MKKENELKELEKLDKDFSKLKSEANVIRVTNLKIGELNAKLELREENWYYSRVGELQYRSYLYLPKPIECKICKKVLKNDEIARLVFPQLWLVCEDCLDFVRKGFFEHITLVTLVIQNES